jgi:hypothetical protein
MKIRKTSLFVAALLAIALATGCGPNVMRQSTLKKPTAEKALVTFLRPTVFGGAIDFGLWDRDHFIGVLNPRNVIQYEATPGEHLFLARAENWSYLEATLEPGKRYYVIGKVFPGVWKARVGLSPVVKGSEITQKQIDEWVSGGTPYEVIPEQLEAYEAPRQAQVQEAIAIYENGEAKFEVLEATDYWK